MRSGRARLCAVSVAAVALIMLIAGIVANAADADQVIRITAKRFEYSPREITVME
jgi:hypothetical protein